MYDLPSGNWIWMKGDSDLVTQPSYGTFRVEDPANTPGSRTGAYTWTDTSGNFWLQGGSTYSQGGQTLADLWKFNYKSKNWVWMKGTGDGNNFPETVYGTQGIEDELNQPGERFNGVTWVAAQNNLWLMGGLAFHSTLNELWRFNTSTLNWAWVKGSSDYYSYGTMGVTSPSNIPPRHAFSSSWRDKNGGFWMFGGLWEPRIGNSQFYNDLWRFSGGQVILANSILNFNAVRKMDYAELTWNAANENDIKGYTLQRKSGNDFITVAFITAKPGHSGSNNYSYSDFNTSMAPSYYRLVQVNNSGKEVAGLIRMIEGLKSNNNIIVYPNPSWGQAITVLFNNTETKNIMLLNSSGMLVQKWNNYTGRQLQLESLRPGMYLLKINNSSMELVETKKIIVAK
jgi:hypothetical protein